MSAEHSTMPPVELTLVLAATRNMGIGRAGTLPWTGLKKEMAYFARVTKRLPPEAHPSAVNAVIMGRKTWDSIPPRFRPLKGRLNIVISRSHAVEEEGDQGKDGHVASSSPARPLINVDEPMRVSSLAKAIEYVTRAGSGSGGGNGQGGVGRVFVIGGAQIYGAALGMREARRVLLTSVATAFECDAFFTLGLEGAEGEQVGGGAARWVRRTKGELDGWTGEVVPEGVQEEAGTEYEFQMWERVD